MFLDALRPNASETLQEVEETVILPSSQVRIPQSVVRSEHGVERSKNPMFGFVQATPTRKSLSGSNPSGSMISVNVLDYNEVPASQLGAPASNSQTPYLNRLGRRFQFILFSMEFWKHP